MQAQPWKQGQPWKSGASAPRYATNNLAGFSPRDRFPSQIQSLISGTDESPVTTSPEIRTLSTPQELFSAAADELIHAATDAVAAHGRFTIALSGGSTPKSLFNLLAANARTTLPWDKMFF